MAQAAIIDIFCDLDGTLIDVSARHYQVYVDVVGIFGGKPLEQGVYWDLKRKKTKWADILLMSQMATMAEDDFLAEFIKKIEAPEYLKLDMLFPGVLTVLDGLSQTYHCYLVSLRRNRQNLLDELNWLGLVPHFTEVLTGHSENDGYDVKIALIKDKLSGHNGVIIGDTEADIVTGKELNLTTIALTSGIRDEQFLAGLKPDYLLHGIIEIQKLPLFIESRGPSGAAY